MNERKAAMGLLKERYLRQIDLQVASKSDVPKSREYLQFKQASMPPRITFYEDLCNRAEKVLAIAPDKKTQEDLKEHIRVAHLDISPKGVYSFAVLAPLLYVVIGIMFSFLVLQSLFFVIFFLLSGIAAMFTLLKVPSLIANTWRMKTSNQMVLSVFYIVTYMRHTSNLELAVEFAADHLAPPLALDLKKVLWDVETESYDSIKESLNDYLQTWRKYNMEYIEAMHLIESSLYEPSEDRRLNLLDKSLDVILEETYEKMLHYAQNLKSPITLLYMLGIILPILGLVILPLVVSLMEGVKWYTLAVLYNITLPLAVYLLGRSVLSSRPTGYGDTDISEENPELKKYRNLLVNVAGFELKISPKIIAFGLFIVLLILGLLPFIIHWADPYFDIPIGNFKLLEYRESAEGVVSGPFGIGASLLSLCVTLSLGVSIGVYYKLTSMNVIKLRNRAKELEQEFASALFQLGNRLGDGMPAEMAVGKVAQVMQDTVSGNFFATVSSNIRQLGMSVEDAIFDPQRGALVYFPSTLIESAMKVLIQSVKKGPRVAAQALLNVARYIREIHRVNERLQDLMSDIVASMNSQIKFLTPAISAIVIGITSMITSILGQLSSQLSTVTQGASADAPQAGILASFGQGIPTYHFQIIVGIYVVEIVYILTVISNGIENGADVLTEKYTLGKNMVNASIIYCSAAAILIVLFNVIAGSILTNTFTS